jgi:hypothetical protein
MRKIKILNQYKLKIKLQSNIIYNQVIVVKNL